MARGTEEEEVWSGERLVDVLRGRIVGGVHTGRLSAGDRLPSYREIGEETGMDLRAVAHAYRTLEAEGLVEVRGRSGVFVARLERIGGRVLAETARWVVGALREAWTRRIPVPGLPDFVRECTATRVVRCAFVESTVDQIETFCGELRTDFGFDAAAVHLGRFAPLVVDGAARPRVPEEARDADFLATTVFHAAEVRELAQGLGKPLVVIRLNRAFVQQVQRRVAEAELPVLCADVRFVDRVRLIAGAAYTDRVRAVPASDAEAVAELDLGRPVLITDAARRELPGVTLPASFPEEPMIGPDAAEELAEMLVRMNLETVRNGNGVGT